MSSPSAAPMPPSGALGAWHRTLQGHGLAALVTLVLLAFAAVAVTVDFRFTGVIPAEQLESAAWLASSAVQGLWLGALVAVWFAPAAGVWLGTAALLAASLTETQTTGWVALGGACVLLGLGLADAAGRRRQRAASVRWSSGPVTLPECVPGERGHAERWRAGWTTLGGVLLVVAVVLLAVFVRDFAAVKAFRAEARVAVGTVVAVADDDMSAVVDVDGLRLDVPTPTVYVDIDEQVGVRYDGNGRTELVDDGDDPSWSLLLAVAALVAGLTLVVRERERRRAVRRLLTFGGPAVRLLATTDGSWGVRLADPEAPGVVVATSGRLLNLRPFEAAEGVEDDREWERPVREVADSELLRLARERLADALGTAEPTTPRGGGSLSTPDVWQGTAVDVVGLVAHGAPVALRGPDGAWWVTEVGVRGPEDWLRRRWRTVRQASGSAGPGAVLGGDTDSTDPDTADALGTAGAPSVGGSSSGAPSVDATTVRIAGLVRRSGSVGPWLVAVAAPAAAWWMDPGVVGTLVGAFTLGSTLHGWSAAAPTPLKVTPSALVARQGALDELYPWVRVEDVAADDGALVVRLHPSEVEPADALLFATPPGTPLLPGITDPREARRLVLAARDAAIPRARADTRTRRRLSTATVVTAVGVVGWVAASFLG